MITEEKVRQYAALSGDFNEIHLDQRKAEQSGFKEPIAHGMLTMGLISNIAADFIDKGMAILTYEMQFIRPVYVNTVLKVIAEIGEKEQNSTQLKITAWSGAEAVVKGELTLI